MHEPVDALDLWTTYSFRPRHSEEAAAAAHHRAAMIAHGPLRLRSHPGAHLPTHCALTLNPKP